MDPPDIQNLFAKRKPKYVIIKIGGALAEWLRSGLQNRVHRFNSGRHLQNQRFLGGPSIGRRFGKENKFSFRSPPTMGWHLFILENHQFH